MVAAHANYAICFDRLGRLDEATTAYRKLVEIDPTTGSKAKLRAMLMRTGRTDEARTELATAVAMLREMGMTFWLPEAERELAEATS